MAMQFIIHVKQVAILVITTSLQSIAMCGVLMQVMCGVLMQV